MYWLNKLLTSLLNFWDEFRAETKIYTYTDTYVREVYPRIAMDHEVLRGEDRRLVLANAKYRAYSMGDYVAIFRLDDGYMFGGSFVREIKVNASTQKGLKRIINACRKHLRRSPKVILLR